MNEKYPVLWVQVPPRSKTNSETARRLSLHQISFLYAYSHKQVRSSRNDVIFLRLHRLHPLSSGNNNTVTLADFEMARRNRIHTSTQSNAILVRVIRIAVLVVFSSLVFILVPSNSQPKGAHFKASTFPNFRSPWERSCQHLHPVYKESNKLYTKGAYFLKSMGLPTYLESDLSLRYRASISTLQNNVILQPLFRILI